MSMPVSNTLTVQVMASADELGDRIRRILRDSNATNGYVTVAAFAGSAGFVVVKQGDGSFTIEQVTDGDEDRADAVRDALNTDREGRTDESGEAELVFPAPPEDPDEDRAYQAYSDREVNGEAR